MSETCKADWIEASTLLKGLREWREDTQEDVVKRLVNKLKTSDPSHYQELRQLVKTAEGADKLIQKLEKPGKDVRPDLDRWTIRALCVAYDAPTLLLDSLLSKTLPDTNDVLIESFEDFDDVTLDQVEYGSDATYAIPKNKLSSWMDVCIGSLKLESGGRSDYHDHPGSELVFVREGEAELRLENSGAQIPIKQHEFAHFRSEICHSVLNNSKEPVDILIVRFYQLASSSSRKRALQIVRDSVKTGELLGKQIAEIKSIFEPNPGTKEKKSGRDEAGDKTEDESNRSQQSNGSEEPKSVELSAPLTEIRSVLKAQRVGRIKRLYKDLDTLMRSATKRVSADVLRNNRRRKPQVVYDLFGLGVFLNRLKGKMTLDDLAKIGPLKRGVLAQVHHGERSLTLDDLEDLAKQHGVQPMLLYPFLYPAEPNIIVGRQSEMVEVPTALTDISYRIPPSNLALADMNISLIEFEPHTETRPNRHPGSELVVPIGDAKLEIVIGKKEYPVDGSKGQFAHFISREKHQVRNPSDGSTHALVIRFHADNPRFP